MKVWFDVNLAKESTFFLNVLNDPRAWNIGHWTKTNQKKNADWIVYLKSTEYIDMLTCTSKSCFTGFSVTLMDENPRVTLFNFENWTNVPKNLKNYSVNDYRTYLILHEFGHAICSLDHPRKIVFGPCPIMVQQTRGLPEGTTKNLWPLELEKKKALKNV
jgi:hypothetical protein